MVLDIFWMMWSNCEHADCHWFSVSWSNERRSVILFNWIAFSSKNIVLNFSKFFWGMRFIILVVRVVGGGGCIASSLFGGMCKIIGRWSEFRLGSKSVVDVYILEFWVLV